MKKDFITVTPDSGTGNATVTVVASKNWAPDERSTSISISGGTMKRTLSINQEAAPIKVVLIESIVVNVPNQWSTTPPNLEGGYIEKGINITMMFKPTGSENNPCIDAEITFGEEITDIQLSDNVNWIISSNKKLLKIVKFSNDAFKSCMASLKFNNEQDYFCNFLFTL